ncbi:MAG TPA: RES family NAD+ phosphorylase [Longimicrobiales bacterium]|nr:RES family NAD+ phosphorylase [Longimicrobiales bacterium]
MQSSIWTQCGGVSELTELRLSPYRAVEAQHQISTRKLVASDAEQALLEELIDGSKPPDVTAGRLHYLLSTPFRYPPLRHGSRFGARHERGIWYGSEALRTLFAEVAYYRLLFLAGTHAALEPLTTALTTFRARVQTARGIDLTRPPFDAHREQLASRVRYDATQALGTALRADDVAVLRYTSARDVAGGSNVAVLSPAAFGRRRPQELRTWHCTSMHTHVEVAARDYFAREVHTYAAADFMVNGALPAPAL